MGSDDCLKDLALTNSSTKRRTNTDLAASFVPYGIVKPVTGLTLLPQKLFVQAS